MKLPLAYYGDAVLRKKAEPITTIDASIHELVRDMTDTLIAHDGCGLAAPQVHRSIALFITCIPYSVDGDTWLPGEIRVFINPKVLLHSNETWPCDQGCLSIPGLSGSVVRPKKILIRATDFERESFEEEFDTFAAQVFLHENDHLNGVLYIDRLDSSEKKRMAPHLKKIKEKYSGQN